MQFSSKLLKIYGRPLASQAIELHFAANDHQNLTFNLSYNVYDLYAFKNTTLRIVIYNTDPQRAFPIPDQEVHVNEEFELIIPLLSYVDPDIFDPQLIFTAFQGNGSQLPPFVQYYAQTRTFRGQFSHACFNEEAWLTCAQSGTGKLDVLGNQIRQKICTFPVRVVISDGFWDVEDQFKIIVRDFAPYPHRVIYSESATSTNVLRLHVSQRLQLFLEHDTFMDADDETPSLKYSLSLLAANGSHTAPPAFIHFYPEIKALYGVASTENIYNASVCADYLSAAPPYNYQNQVVNIPVYSCTYRLCFTVTDQSLLSRQVLTLIIYNHNPFSGKPLYGSGLEARPYYQCVNQRMEFTFDSDVFVDADQADTLEFRMSAANSSQSLPPWLHFYPNLRQISGYPNQGDHFLRCDRQNVTNPDTHYLNYFGDYIPVEESQCVIRVNITAFDLRESVVQTLTIVIYNSKPVVHQPVFHGERSALPLRVHVNEFFEHFFPDPFIEDPDANSLLVFTLYLIVNDTLAAPPAWLNYDTFVQKFSGYPKRADLMEECVSSYQVREQHLHVKNHLGKNLFINEQVCPFRVRIRATDGYDSVTTDADVELYNSVPYLYYPISHQTLFSQTIHVSDFFTFLFSADTFRDLDSETEVVYKIFLTNNQSQIPEWLHFDYEKRYLFGTPLLQDLQGAGCLTGTKIRSHPALVKNWRGEAISLQETLCEYNITVVVSDAAANTSDGFTLVISNYYPYQFRPFNVLESGVTDVIFTHIWQDINYYLPADFTLDLDRTDTKRRQITAVEYGKAQLPDWLEFHPQMYAFQGTPGTLDLYEYCDGGRFSTEKVIVKNYLGEKQYNQVHRCSFLLNLTVTDTYDSYSANLTIVIYNSQPYIFQPVYLENNVEAVINFHAGGYFEYSIPYNAFLDADADDLEIQIVDNETEQVPQWIKYYQTSRRLVGRPKKEDIREYTLKVTASDGHLVVHNWLRVRIYNLPPVFTGSANPIYLVMEQNFLLKIPSETLSFSDPDNDPLSYKMRCFAAAGQLRLPLKECAPWLIFDEERKILYGTPTVLYNFPFDSIAGRFYQEIVLEVTATDIVDLSVNATFTIVVDHQVPCVNPYEKSIQK